MSAQLSGQLGNDKLQPPAVELYLHIHRPTWLGTRCYAAMTQAAFSNLLAATGCLRWTPVWRQFSTSDKPTSGTNKSEISGKPMKILYYIVSCLFYYITSLIVIFPLHMYLESLE